MTRETTDPAAPREHSAPDSVRRPAAGRLLSVNVCMPKDVPWQGMTVFTGVFKDSVSGPRRVGKLNVEGDGQGDLAGHGGEQRAVFVYQIDSYRYWERELGETTLFTVNSVKTSPSRGSATTRYTSATVTRSGLPPSRSRSRASRVTASGSG
jgi:hypothetical protein